eukprot:gb/GEZN01022163.1/.p1 GENE.gb/GEZN01022163.1/~~gb/GEZN01022163.1/.p1  ORF type:complete len:119 (-),score=31.44 gb/GEZN01022163.1/:272-628(-)
MPGVESKKTAAVQDITEEDFQNVFDTPATTDSKKTETTESKAGVAATAELPVAEEAKVAAEPEDEELKELMKQFGSQVTALARMGFANNLLNCYLLNKHKGSLEETITWLLKLDVNRT